MKDLPSKLTLAGILHILLIFILTIITIPSTLPHTQVSANANTDPIEGRYSFSLTTFHPSGRLPQLSHATTASTHGPPILYLHSPQHNTAILASLQSLPSPLIRDDGTARFVKITDSIVMGHTGINADGRAVIEAAQRLAVEHAYTFQEEIPLDVLLEEMALLFQEYTMKAGVRPFGCFLIVAGIRSGAKSCEHADGGANGGVFKIDPSGSVERLEDVGLIGKGGLRGEDDEKRILDKVKLEETTLNDSNDVSKYTESVEELLIHALRDEVRGGKLATCQSIICATLSNEKGSSKLKRVPVEDDTKKS